MEEEGYAIVHYRCHQNRVYTMRALTQKRENIIRMICCLVALLGSMRTVGQQRSVVEGREDRSNVARYNKL